MTLSEQLIRQSNLIRNRLLNLQTFVDEGKMTKEEAVRMSVEMGSNAICKKCGAEVLGDTDSLCGECI